MNRLELAEKIALEHDISKAEAARILGTVLDTIVATVKKGDTVSIVGFGTFKRAERAARTGRNPATGESLKMPAVKLPKFVPGTAFKDAVDAKAAKRRAEKKAG